MNCSELYFNYLKKFKEEDSIIGDFCRDVCRDKNFPKNKNYSAIISYLNSKNACNEAFESFKKTYRDFIEQEYQTIIVLKSNISYIIKKDDAWIVYLEGNKHWVIVPEGIISENEFCELILAKKGKSE